jgi:beta-glucanase (GH16 family)
MFPTELKYGVWAASGEIDIMESTNDMKKITQGLHFGGAGGCSGVGGSGA